MMNLRTPSGNPVRRWRNWDIGISDALFEYLHGERQWYLIRKDGPFAETERVPVVRVPEEVFDCQRRHHCKRVRWDDTFKEATPDHSRDNGRRPRHTVTRTVVVERPVVRTRTVVEHRVRRDSSSEAAAAAIGFLAGAVAGSMSKK